MTAATARPVAHKLGDVVHMTHPDMGHGDRPMVVMALAAGRVTLMPLSHKQCRHIAVAVMPNWHDASYPAPNRVMGMAAARVPAASRPPRGWDRVAAVDACWDAWEAFQAAAPRLAAAL